MKIIEIVRMVIKNPIQWLMDYLEKRMPETIDIYLEKAIAFPLLGDPREDNSVCVLEGVEENSGKDIFAPSATKQEDFFPDMFPDNPYITFIRKIKDDKTGKKIDIYYRIKKENLQYKT